MVGGVAYLFSVSVVPKLYGEVRRPSGQMMSTADFFLFDLQDLGCRIYTFCTTLLYLLEAAAIARRVATRS